jgi:glycosyltransferase involved in cell wall biosynthesis
MRNTEFSLFYPYVIDKEYARMLCESIKDKPVIVYGTGIYGWAIRNYLCDIGGDIVCFCDKNPLKQSFEYFGKKVIPPEKLTEFLTENTVVVISLGPQFSADIEKIRKSLIALGVSGDNINTLRFSKATRPISVPSPTESIDISDIDFNINKPLLPEEFYKSCAEAQDDKIGVFMKVYLDPIPYVVRSINSIREQSYKNLDIVVLANGCPPQTYELLQLFAKADNRIRLIFSKENWAAMPPRDFRSFAKKLSETVEGSHKYYIWSDADDCYAPDFVEKAVAAMRRDNSDMVVGGVHRYDEDGPRSIYSAASGFENRCFDGKDAIGRFLCEYGVHALSYWGKLFSAKTYAGVWEYFYSDGPFSRMSLATPHNFGINDNPAFIRAYSSCSRISVITDDSYFWTKRSGSVSNYKNDCGGFFFRFIELAETARAMLEINEIPEVYIKQLTDLFKQHMALYIDLNLLEENAAGNPAAGKAALLKIKTYITEHDSENTAAILRIDEILKNLG